MLKALLITTEFPPTIGGAGRWSSDITRVLANHPKVELELLVSDQAFVAQDIKVCVHKAHWIEKLYPITFMNTLRTLDTRIYDIVLLANEGALQIGVYMFDRAMRSKTLCVFHGSEPENATEKLSWFKRLTNYPSRLATHLEESCGLVAVSEYMKAKMITAWPNVKIAEKTHVIKNGVDTDTFYPDPVDLKAEFGLSPDARLLLTVSRIVAGKGFARMLDVFQVVHSRDQRFHWIVCGDGNYLDTMKAQVNERGLRESVILMGRCSTERLRKIYSSCDLFFLLSELNEAFGLVYLEAAACGTFSLGRDMHGVREAISTGISGIKVTSIEEAIDFIVDFKITAEMRRICREYAEGCSIRKRGEEIVALMSNIIQKKEIN